MNILLIGSGAREHALARALKQSLHQHKLFCLATNLNPGIINLCSELLVEDINDASAVVDYAKKNNVSLAIIGPEGPLSAGVSDALWVSNIGVVGPKKNLAKVETSKSFARNLLKKNGLTCNPKYKTFNSMEGASDYLDWLGKNYVIKYDGLAGGKGVRVSGEHLHSRSDALSYCDELVRSGGTFIIEEKFIGQEFSLMSFCDGKTLRHMPAVQDHKRAFDGDKGPNTGGMGTYSDSNHSLPFLMESDILEAHKINEQALRALQNEFSEEYKGILYGGFMATENGIKLIEYNARFGDPEAMNVLSLLESDLIDICMGIVNGSLNKCLVKFKNLATVCKYAVPNGYPTNPIKNKPINVSNVNRQEGFFYASVNLKKNDIIESGSRTVAFVGTGKTIAEAELIAEKGISSVGGPLFHRKDIGTQGLIDKKISHMQSLR